MYNVAVRRGYCCWSFGRLSFDVWDLVALHCVSPGRHEKHRNATLFSPVTVVNNNVFRCGSLERMTKERCNVEAGCGRADGGGSAEPGGHHLSPTLEQEASRAETKRHGRLRSCLIYRSGFPHTPTNSTNVPYGS
ncbi:hypothetical protein CBL_06105 [Carabus blaptoides fortunei]